jgi:hypothetical protein
MSMDDDSGVDTPRATECLYPRRESLSLLDTVFEAGLWRRSDARCRRMYFAKAASSKT